MLALVNRLGLQPYCLFVGNRPDVERYYNACDVTALSSLFEGTPNAAFESMASDVPVVATDVSDHRHVIPDGKVGYVVPFQNVDGFARHLRQLLLQDEARRAMSRRARSWVMEEFSCLRLAEKTANVYEEALTLTPSQKGTRPALGLLSILPLCDK